MFRRLQESGGEASDDKGSCLLGLSGDYVHLPGDGKSKLSLPTIEFKSYSLYSE